MSWILTSFSWTYALLQVPAGWLAERFGPRRMLYWANLLWSLLTAATPLGGTFAGFVAIRALLGVGQSADWPSSIVAIRRWFPHSERAKGNSILLGGLYLGPIAAAPITTWVILHFGWPWAFYSFGLLGLRSASRGGCGSATARPNTQPSPRRKPPISGPVSTMPSIIPPGAFLRCLPASRFWAIGLQYFFLVLIQSFYTTWLPTYLVDERKLSLASMGIYASLPWVRCSRPCSSPARWVTRSHVNDSEATRQ